jgi:23S rRNA pseudoU1915 N3-methylase RlmH
MADIDIFSMTKQSAERRTRSIDFADKIPATVTLSSAVAVVTITATGEVVTGSLLATGTCTISGTNASFVVLGGSNGVDYKITVTATLSSSDILTADIMLRVKDY